MYTDEEMHLFLISEEVTRLPHSKTDTILVSGATGYIGGRLVPLLLEKDYRVRCLVRDPCRTEGRGWDKAEVVEADAFDYHAILTALEGVHTAYYLMQSLSGTEGCRDRDILYAQNFGIASKEAGVKRIIYLNPIHFNEFRQIGDCLREYGVPVVEFRSSPIIGAGSITFELIRNLMDKISLLLLSKADQTKISPIAVDDVLIYLTDSLDIMGLEPAVIDIAGSEELFLREMLLKYAQIQGMKRKIIELPFMGEVLTAFFADLITPIPRKTVLSLFKGLGKGNLPSIDTAKRLFGFTPKNYAEAVRAALDDEKNGEIVTSWQDAYSAYRNYYSTYQELRQPVKYSGQAVKYKDRRQITTDASSEDTFQVICCFGGEEGWFYGNWLWVLRGFLDRLFGGAGLRRGRRCPIKLRTGDVLGFWRVEELTDNRLLRLRSEMKMKSQAWLQYEVEEQEDGNVLITQTALFQPGGMLGHMYWWAIWPIHELTFRGMLRTIARKAERISSCNIKSSRV